MVLLSFSRVSILSFTHHLFICSKRCPIAWSNNTAFPPKTNLNVNQKLHSGFDAIIGQNFNQARWMTGYDPKAQSKCLVLCKEYVISRGGEYFFIPSIAALNEVISA
jgi:hypothetical protein